MIGTKFNAKIVVRWTSKTKTISPYTLSHGWKKPKWGQLCTVDPKHNYISSLVGLSGTWKKTVLNRAVFHGQLILKNIQSSRHCPLLYFLGIKKKTFKEKPNFWFAMFLAIGHVLSHRGLGWPARWLSCQPWCLHQNPVYRYCSSNFRV